MSKITKELKAAVREGRQPQCPFCGLPLEVHQSEESLIRWRWSAEKQRYEQEESLPSAQMPMCAYCAESDWAFVDGDTDRDVYEKLGLMYD